jgi:hypothetical protein
VDRAARGRAFREDLAGDQARAAHDDVARTDAQARATMTLAGKVVIIDGGSDDAELADGGALDSLGNFDALLALEKMDLVGNLERMQRILEDLNTLASQLRLGDGRLPEAISSSSSSRSAVKRRSTTLGNCSIMKSCTTKPSSVGLRARPSRSTWTTTWRRWPSRRRAARWRRRRTR